MNRLIIIGLILSQSMLGQTLTRTLTRNNLYNDLIESYNTVLIEFFVYENGQKDEMYSIELVPETVIIELDQPYDSLAITLRTDSIERKAIIDSFIHQGLLNKIFVRINDDYVNVDSSFESFKENDITPRIELFYQKDYYFNQIFIPILDKCRAVEILNSISKLLNTNQAKFFNKLVKIVQPRSITPGIANSGLEGIELQLFKVNSVLPGLLIAPNSATGHTRKRWASCNTNYWINDEL